METETKASSEEQAKTAMPVAMDTLDPPPPSSSKTLKRCLSVPIIRTPSGRPSPHAPMTTRAAAAAAAAAKEHEQTPKKNPPQHQQQEHYASKCNSTIDYFGKSMHIRSQPNSREVSPAPVFNIFAPRARRYSASYSPMSTANGAANGAALCLTPRVSQLRQEECADLNSREVNHEREVHREIQISQSWEDLTLVAENWSCKSEELSNPLQVTLPPTGSTSCSSPSPTSNRAGMRLPYSPSPTRRTFATRRSMSPIAMRPSQLGPVKRKFELDDNPGGSNWSVYSPSPMKKMFTESSRGSSPVCQSPSSVCPSPDSGTYDGRITPKLFISKLCTNNAVGAGGQNNNSSSSGCPSPSSASPGAGGSSGTGMDASSSLEPMCLALSGSSQSQSIDEGISIPESELNSCRSRTSSILSTASSSTQVLVNDLADDATLMDDAKSETSSIGGCSTISIESSSCDSGAKTAATFLNRLVVDDGNSPLAQKSFYINKQGLLGAKKYIVNHHEGGGGGGAAAGKDVQQKL
ncbi:flocculation protein FLO11 isoform X1 [Drosophila subobscura]|uniref:flocculation protein FLO11 isoform X1 n=1 Tax=Drosophila subobscura TaxID=7241 RepID=UPI00155A1DCF|nr:flocculation protein FLO11 isoform X1 [Drosophila subobscura]XP_034666750.1 flocculation protein FLO11 isoform X1 [Drosophila subobscura]